MNNSHIDTILTPALVSLSEPPQQKRDCIEFLLDLAVEAGRVEDRADALDALLAREQETTTGVGKGIGIPHAKTDAVREPTLAFTRSSVGVDFDAMDDEPATLIFMILVPESGADDHLSLLSSLSRALMHDDVREDLHSASSPKAVCATVREAIA